MLFTANLTLEQLEILVLFLGKARLKPDNVKRMTEILGTSEQSTRGSVYNLYELFLGALGRIPKCRGHDIDIRVVDQEDILGCQLRGLDGIGQGSVFYDISTAHLHPADDRVLWENGEPQHHFPYFCGHHGYGWLFVIPSSGAWFETIADGAYKEMSQNFFDVMQALIGDVPPDTPVVVKFDTDAPVQSTLPSFLKEWEGAAGRKPKA